MKMTSKQIVARLMKKCGFVQGKEGGTSAYLELGILTFRISNHKTHLWTWEYNYGSNFPRNMVSLVFEDTPTTSQPILKHPISNAFTVNEWTYESSDLSLDEVDCIAKEINAYKRQYQCPIGKGSHTPVTSINPIIDVESAQWNASTSKVDFSNTLWEKVYKNLRDAEKDIRLFAQKHPVLPNNPIPIYQVVYNCPDTPREVIATFAQCSRKVASKMGITTTATPLLESNSNVNLLRITESDVRDMVRECIERILVEEAYKPRYHNKAIKLDNGVKVKSLVTLSDGAGEFDIYEDDGCYVVWNRKFKGENNHWYIFPELLSALKKLPNLPLR